MMTNHFSLCVLMNWVEITLVVCCWISFTVISVHETSDSHLNAFGIAIFVVL